MHCHSRSSTLVTMHKHVLTAFYCVIVLQVFEAVLCRPTSGMLMPRHSRHCRSDAVSGPIYSASWDIAYIADMSVDMDIHGYGYPWISTENLWIWIWIWM